jgi:hypothetical protein
MTRRRQVLRLGVIVVVAGSSACGSDRVPPAASLSSTTTTAVSDAGPPTSPPVASPPNASPPNASTPPTSTPSSATATVDTAAITAAFTTFFDGADLNVDHKVAVLEHGDELRSMLEDASANPQFMQLTTVIDSIEPIDGVACAAAGETAPCVLVVHDLFVGGLPAMVKLNSHAVWDGQTWKVSKSSWCAIVKIGGESCPGSP